MKTKATSPMINLQIKYDRWKDLSLRFAKVWHSGESPEPGIPSLETTTEEIESFFSFFVPKDLDGVTRWEDPLGEHGYICDYVSGLSDEYWSRWRHHTTRGEDARLSLLENCYEAILWSRKPGSYERAKLLESAMHEYGERLQEAIADRWESPLHWCVRGAMCLVFESGPGITISVEEIQRLYPEGMPDWVAIQFTEAFWKDEKDEIVLI